MTTKIKSLKTDCIKIREWEKIINTSNEYVYIKMLITTFISSESPNSFPGQLNRHSLIFRGSGLQNVLFDMLITNIDNINEIVTRQRQPL